MEEFKIIMPAMDDIISKLETIEQKLDMASKSSQFKPVLSPKEASALLGRTIRTLQNWRNMGTGPAFIQFGDNIWYCAEDIQQFLMEHYVKSRFQEGDVHEG